MIKLIASDMDGTLLGSDHKISKENIEAIRLAQDRGIKFAIATGRAYDDVKPFLDEHNLKCECVVLNGGQYRNIDGKTVAGIYIDKNKASEILKVMSTYPLSVEIYTDNGYYTTNTKEETLAGMIKREKTFHPEITDTDEIYKYAIKNPHFVNMNYITDMEVFLGNDVNIGKFVSFSESLEEIANLKEQLSKIDGLAISSSFITNIEINHANATKGKLLAQVAENINIKKDEVAVLGDSSNDYSMFMEFPNSVAMENAIPEIKKVAKYITSSNLEHGVAKAIYRILDSNK
ncbi:MAG: HAD-superfamily hydrolase, subfamily [Clostridiaceae bacterium]|nr:HAD-superfamily hydrolase, subfamily [Clostridiaceae bacterium]